MGRRYRFLLLCVISGTVMLIILNFGSSFHGTVLISSSASFGHYLEKNGNNGWNLPSLFQIPKNNGVEEGVEENEEVDTGGGESLEENVGPEKTVVLMWTRYYTVKNSQLMEAIFSGRKYDPDCCLGDDLVVTLDRRLLPRATAIVFFNYHGNLNKSDLPPTRTPDQLWVLFSKESPAHSLGLGNFPNLFNWTMSYRLDSDIYSPYGFATRLSTPLPPNSPILVSNNSIPLATWFENKSEMVAGVISHCPTASKRERLAQALRNASLSVDIFGGCGNRSICPRSRLSCDHDAWFQNLAAKYKFYYAAENSLCVDYITEKFWRTLTLGMIPVVYGGANYSAVAPPNSFINVADFGSPEEVAEHLRFVADDYSEYQKYFEWKREWNVTLTDGWGGWCTLCRVARQFKNTPESVDVPLNSYESLSNWWLKWEKGSDRGACLKPPFDLPDPPKKKRKGRKH